MATRPLRFGGKELVLNYATSAAGGVRVGLADAAAPIPQFGLYECDEIIGDEIERVVRWKGGSDVSELAGQPVRLQFRMKDADLYSMQFR